MLLFQMDNIALLHLVITGEGWRLHEKQPHQRLMIFYIHGLIIILLQERLINLMQTPVPLLRVLLEEVPPQDKSGISIKE